ncbi:MAG: beta-lactamase family protein [Candidatus Eremiobacteraeota bacterium]|nr:beta-lactamase family protein [Candidatus Eremiobacteraeota bacterium]
MRFLAISRRALIAVSVTCVSLLGCTNTSTTLSQGSPVAEAAVAAAIAPYIGTQVPGMSVAIGYHGRVIFAKGYGKSDLASGAPMTAQTRLGIGSVTKQMTAGALLTLQRDGLLSIDQKVKVLLPQYFYGNRMTLHELSTLSGGMQGHDEDPNGDVTFGIVGASTGNSTVPQVLAKLNATPPIRPPNTKWDYSNISYWLLGRTIEAATKGSYAQAMQARVFGPLGMKTAYIRGTQPDVNLATGYTRFTDGTFHKCPELNLTTSDSAGTAAMTASDVVAWDEGVRAKRLVPDPLAKVMFEPNGLPIGKPFGDSYAMGWFVRNDPTLGYGIFDAPGDTLLYTSLNVLFPDGSDVVLLTNANFNTVVAERNLIAYKVHNAIAGLPPVKLFPGGGNLPTKKCQNE